MSNLKLFFANETNIFNAISLGLSAVGGLLSRFFGGFDGTLIALTTLVVLDYLTGVIKAIYLKRLSSAIGYKGIIKKIMMFIIVGVSVVLQNLMPGTIPLREITITFFICNEGLSILENASEVIPIPLKIKKVLLQLRKSNEDALQDSDKESLSAAEQSDSSNESSNTATEKPKEENKEA